MNIFYELSELIAILQIYLYTNNWLQINWLVSIWWQLWRLMSEGIVPDQVNNSTLPAKLTIQTTEQSH